MAERLVSWSTMINLTNLSQMPRRVEGEQEGVRKHLNLGMGSLSAFLFFYFVFTEDVSLISFSSQSLSRLLPFSFSLPFLSSSHIHIFPLSLSLSPSVFLPQVESHESALFLSYFKNGLRWELVQVRISWHEMYARTCARTAHIHTHTCQTCFQVI